MSWWKEIEVFVVGLWRQRGNTSPLIFVERIREEA
jgi:hypothetical protein